LGRDDGPLQVELRLDNDSLVRRAVASLELRDYRQALADLQEAFAHAPDRADVRHRLVGLLTNGPLPLRDPDRAFELVHGALSQDPADNAALGDLGMVLYRQRRDVEAAATLEKTICSHGDPSDLARWRIVLALCQYRQGLSRAAWHTYLLAKSARAEAHPSPAVADELERLHAEAETWLRGGTAPP
jgi:Tfp pilus assembly protein PilF